VRRSKAEIYLHCVWATYRRLPLIRPEIEAAVHGQVAGESARCGCEVLAIGGMPDHLHLALRIPVTISVAELMKQVKGVSSTRIRQRLGPGETFGWQDNYGAFSFAAADRPRVVRYIENQKVHHSGGTVEASWEQVAEEVGR